MFVVFMIMMCRKSTCYLSVYVLNLALDGFDSM
jgi:hypothetical protein